MRREAKTVPKKVKMPVIIAVVLALFLPTYAALISYFAILRQPALMSAGHYKISVVQPDGSDLEIDSADTSEMINLFRAMRRDAVSVGNADVSDCYAYNVTLSDGQKSDTICCFFSPEGKGYIRDGSSAFSEIPRRYTDIFLAGSYSYMLYRNSSMPVMVFSGFSVVPKSAEWSYSGYKGKRTFCKVAVADKVAPLVQHGLLAPDAALTCHSVTGYSGGGKKMISAYGEADRSPLYDAPRQYGLSQTHKHLPEMTAMCGLQSPPIFCPIVADFYSGMVVTVPLFAHQLTPGATAADVKAVLKAAYGGSIVRYVVTADADGFLSAAALSGKDAMEVAVFGSETRILLTARYDNLGKGASGAAVECMNLVLGVDPATGLNL